MNIKLIIKSFIVGIGKIIPGVSGSMLAMTLGIYKEIINSITNFFSNPKLNIKILINFSIGLLSSIFIFSKLILFLLNKYYYPTMSIFLGLIIGTIFKFSKKLNYNKKSIIIIILLFISVLSLSFLNINLSYTFKYNLINYLYVILLGFIDAFTSIVPGISGTAIFILLGSYSFVLNTLSHPLTIPFILYSIGLLLGIIITSYIMNYLLKNYENKTNIIILAFSLGSIFLILIPILKSISLLNIIFLIIGVSLGLLFDN